jgi:hypothetical protein
MKRTVMAVVTLLTVGLLYPVVAAVPALAAGEPDQVTNNLVICKAGSVSTEYIANPDGQGFICSTLPQTDQDTKDFYSGNAGKGWNEFDLVPHRLTMSAGNSAPATQSYTFAIALDAIDVGKLGYDRITDPSKNLALSDAGSGTISFGSTQTLTPGFGGVDTTIYRLVTVTGQAKDTDLVIDFDGRLAIGSHLYPGASLHTNYANQGLTQTGQDRSIQTDEIAPQSISKDLSAVQNADTNWDITKESTPANLEFGDVCSTGTGELSTTVDVTVNWDNLGSVPSDKVEVTTHVYATNPSHRSITVNVSDTVSSGGSALYTVVDNGNVVAANTANELILSDTREIDASLVVGDALSNVATAAYFDTIFQEPVPGTTTATATADVQDGTVSNASVDITDSESITGFGLSFSVADPTVGAFTGGYTADTKTTGPVGWALDDVTADGSVTFNKTVYLEANTGSTTGTLSDTADLNGESISKSTGALDVGITSTASGSVTVNKTTSVPVDEATTFEFEIDPGDIPLTVDFAKGDSSGTGSVSGLALGDYTITETNAGGFAPAVIPPFSIALGNCDVQLDVDNTFGPATATALKVTDPEGNQADWTFNLMLDVTGDGPSIDDTIYATDDTDASGLADFGAVADEGKYYIVEVEQTGWTSDGGKGLECAFTVDYPADADRAFSDCTFTNTARGSIGITKTGGTAGQAFTFELRKDVVAPTNGGTLLDTESVISGGAEVKFKIGGSTDLPLGDYTVCEIIPAAGWSSDLGGVNQYNLTLLDNEIRVCTNVSITVASQDLTIGVANTPPPGGERGTLGFWKTHSCQAPGKQKDEVTKNLPQTLGSYTVVDCPTAVKILSKQNLAGQNKASDPLFNLAAQLLAAELNVKAGASTCPAATAAITQANTLLAKYNWTPSGYTGTVSKTDKTLAGNLTTTLDQYNNGTLAGCP